MKNKILLSLLFLVLFMICISINNNVNAFSFELDNTFYDTDNYDVIELLEYSFCFKNSVGDTIYIFTSNNPITLGHPNDGSYNIQTRKNGTGCDYKVYSINIKNNSCSLSSSGHQDGIVFGYTFSGILYTNYNLCSVADGSVFFNCNDFSSDVKELILYKSIEEQTTTVPIVVYSQDFNESNILKYDMQYSKDNEKWVDSDIRSISSVASGISVYQFYLDVYENGHYYFRLKNSDTGEYFYKDIIVDNIVVTQDSYNKYVNGEFSPTPWFNYEYISDTKIKLYSQKFSEEEIKKLKCSYGKDLNNSDLDNEDKWSSVEIESSYSEINRANEYRFVLYLDNSNLDADGTYFFRFYISEIEDYTYSTVTVSFEKIIQYQNTLNKEQTNKYIMLFRDRLGFLFYPVDLFIKILDKINSINFSEPIISIPDIYEPSTNNKLISAVDYNLNSLLSNDILKNVHDIYLILVDAFIAFSLTKLLYSKLMGVLENG